MGRISDRMGRRGEFRKEMKKAMIFRKTIDRRPKRSALHNIPRPKSLNRRKIYVKRSTPATNRHLQALDGSYKTYDKKENEKIGVKKLLQRTKSDDSEFSNASDVIPPSKSENCKILSI